MKQAKQTVRAGLLATILLLIALATSFAADSGEIKVNEGIDGTPYYRQPAVAADGLGNVIVAWVHSDNTYPNPGKVYTRRYDNSGTAIGGEIPIVALPVSRVVGFYDVAMNDSGAFVVAWTQAFTDADGYSVHAALYDAAANVVRAPFQVNTSEIGDQWSPSVAMDDAGNFLVAWDQKDSLYTGVAEGVYGQFYDSSGNEVGSQFTIDSVSQGYVSQIDVSMAGDGRAIAVWNWEDYFGEGAIHGQRFAADGSSAGAELTLGRSGRVVERPAVTMDDSGAFTAVWRTIDELGHKVIHGRQFDAAGSALDAEFLVGGGEYPDVAGDDAGNFAVVWQADDGTSDGVFARLYDNTGTAQGGVFAVNVGTDQIEDNPTVAMSDLDHYAFAWTRYLYPNNGMDGIYARFFYQASTNTAPVAGDDGYTTDEDVVLQVAAPGVLGNDSDDNDPLTPTLVDGVTNGMLTLDGDGSFSYTPADDYYGSDGFSYQVCDSAGLCDTATVGLTIIPVNDPPIVDAGGPYGGDEGSPITLNGTASDVEGDLLSYAWSSDGPCTFSDTSVPGPTLTCDDDGTFTATLAVSDGATTVSSNATVTVANVAPTIELVEGPTDPVALGAQPVPIQVFFADPGAADTHTTTVDWDDGSADTYSTPSPVSASHTYAAPGVFTLNITVDDDGGSDSAAYEYVVIYDPDGGFVTGHGRIDSAVEGCNDAFPDFPDMPHICDGAGGNARFGFVSRYNRGATAPTGRTDFDFVSGDLHFDSEIYDWLVVNQDDANAQFKGSGSINGALAPNGALYKFQIWAGAGTGSGGEDTFRIKIWFEVDGTEYVVYDNGFDQPIGGGKIMVQAN